MRQKSERHQGSAERTIKDIRRRTRKRYSSRTLNPFGWGQPAFLEAAIPARSRRTRAYSAPTRSRE